MYSGTLQRVVERIDAVKRHVRLSDRFRSSMATGTLQCNSSDQCFFKTSLFDGHFPEPTEWRVIDHCSAVTRLYSLYESFVREMLGDYLAFIEKSLLYKELGADFHKNYQRGIGELIVEIEKDRFNHIDFVSMVKGFAAALAGEDYRLIPDALVRHERNLRLEELDRLFSRCGLIDVKGWIAKHRLMREFFLDTRLAGTADAQLTQLVTYRNDAAHGGAQVDDVLSAEVLCELAEFVQIVCVCLVQRILLETVRKGETREIYRQVGAVTRKLLEEYNSGDGYWRVLDTTDIVHN